MIRLARILGLAAVLALPAQAQDATDDGSFLERKIEELLSGAGRQVVVTGFQGALSSSATLDRMTIADENGVWLTLIGAELNWNRSALLRGRLEVEKLTAEAIDLPRLPQTNPGIDLPSAEAKPFKLPDLPVSVQIGEVSIASVSLGAPLLGEEIALSLDGSASLAGGEGTASLAVERIDGTPGALTLSGSFVNETEALTLDVRLAEPEDGIAARLLNLPGRPSVDLAIEGSGALSDFQADIRLATAGQERLAGQVRLMAGAGGADRPDRRFEAELGGDLAPVFSPQFEPFFGPDIRLIASGTQFGDGRLALDRLDLTARALDLTGQLTLGADKAPQLIDITGHIADPAGAAVLLPIGGGVRVDDLDLDIAFDAARGDGWSADIVLNGLATSGADIARLALTGDGAIQTGASGAEAVTADLTFDATGIALADPGAQTALGESVRGGAALDWTQGAPVVLDRLTVAGASFAFEGRGQVAQTDTGPLASFDGTVEAEDLAAFSTLAGRPLGGGASLTARLGYGLTSRAFDVDVTGRAKDLSIDQRQFDRAFAGNTDLKIVAARDAAGTRLDSLSLTNAAATLGGSANLTSDAAQARLTLSLPDAARIEPKVGGPVDLALDVTGQPGAWNLDLNLTALGAQLTYSGGFDDLAATPVASGHLHLSDFDLARAAPLLDRALAGRVGLDITGSAPIDLSQFQVAGRATGQDLQTGIAELDRLLTGTTDLRIAASKPGENQPIRIDRLSLNTAALQLGAEGRYGAGQSAVTLSARLDDLGRIASDFSGPVSASGRIGEAADGVSLDLTASGPGGMTVNAAGTAALDFKQVNLGIDGAAPLALANTIVAPQSLRGTANFNLRIDGKPGLPALSGTVTTQGARAVLPGPGIVLNDINATVRLTGGTARISATATKQAGGQIAARGTLGLTGSQPVDLTAEMGALVVEDPSLYRTTASGRVSLTGSLKGGTLAAGTITLGSTEIRVPSSGLGTAGPIPDLRHVNEPAAVRATRDRAGLVGAEDGNGAAGGGGSSGTVALDLTVAAPNQIFVRGRGLDAELGGSLRLAGTTKNVIPSGQFELIRGRLDILGKRLELTEGRVTLQGDFKPYLRLVATTEANGTKLFIILEGAVQSPEITFESQPDLPQDEVLAQLLFGKSLSDISPLQAGRLALAVRTLAGKGGEGVVGRLRSQFGLDDLDITTDDDGNAALRAGAYLSENVYSDVTVNASGKTEVNLNLDLTPALTARGTVNNSGETSLGIFFEKDY